MSERFGGNNLESAETEIPQSEKQKQSLVKRLEGHQKEFQEFSEFLKSKYFSEA